MSRNALPILEITHEFFTSPMWNDTIKDFVLANCGIFTGEEEYEIAHQICHREFCQIIENTLNIYLLDIIGIPFDVFQDACLAACKESDHDSIAYSVISILKQATDFRYFAAKMYAYNVMLDREAASTFLLDGQHDTFFVTEGALADQETVVATANLNEVEKELGLPESTPVALEAAVASETPLPPKREKPGLLPPMEPTPKPEPEPEPEPKPQPLMTEVPKVTPEERERMKRQLQQEREKMNANVDPAEIAKRKEAFEKRKQELVSQRREQCREDIELNLKKREKPVAVAEEDPLDALRRALHGRVKTMIDES